MEFRILGPLDVASGAGPVLMAAPKPRALLGVLLLHPNEAVASERLIDELWGARPPATAPKILQTYVSQLRRVLGAEMITTRRPGYLLDIDEEALDASRFRRLAADGHSLAASGHHEAASARYREALALWRGPPLADVVFESFAQNEVERLEEERVAVAMDLTDSELVLGRHEQIVPQLEIQIRQHPLRERLHAQLMLALYRSGRQADALRVYRDARRTLVEELGLEPGRELQELEKAVLAHDPVLDGPPVTATRPGAREGDRLPPLRSLPATNLPVPSTPFLGRAEELDTVVGLLLRADVALVTLTGTGGTGKTRLALQAAAQAAASFPGGVFWVALAPLADADHLPMTVIQALGATDASDRLLPAVVADRTRGAPALFLLDNCEHLLPELAAPIATLRDLPGANVLATSRERLQLQGEVVFAVPPLAEDDAVELFETRAAAVGAPPAPRREVRELCKRLDDLPLALELAAARTVLLSPAQLLARLGERLDLLKGGRDVDPRQRTLRATIQWSHDLLSEDEQRLFRRLAVFSGGCSYEAAVAVSDADPETLQSLLDKSLVRRRQEHREPRYWMLDTLHQFALEQLRAAGEYEEQRRRHLVYFLEFVYASRAVPDRQFGVLPPEQPNVRAAATFAIDQCDAVSLAELAWGVRHVSAHWPEIAEYRAWVAEALRAEPSLPPLLRARMRLLAGWAAWGRDMRASRRHYQAAETLYRQLGDDNGVALARCGGAEITAFEGDLETARATYERVLAEARRTEDVMVMVLALHQLARIALEQADHERAHALASEEVRLAVEQGSYPTSRMLSILALALAELGLGNDDRALHLATQSLVDAHDRGLNSVTWQSLLYLAEIAVVRGADAKAAALLGHADSLARRFEFHLGRLEADLPDRVKRMLAAHLEPQTLAAAEAEGAAMTTDESVALAFSLA